MKGGAEWKIGASESVNVSHSVAVLHGFNKAGTCSVRRGHCAIEGLVHESGGVGEGWRGGGVVAPQPHSSRERSRIEGGVGVWGWGGVTEVQPAATAALIWTRQL